MPACSAPRTIRTKTRCNACLVSEIVVAARGLGAQPILTALPVQNPKAGGQEVRLTMWQGETSRQMLLPAMLVEWLFRLRLAAT